MNQSASLRHQALAQKESGDIQGAVQTLKKALHEQPQDYRAALILADICYLTKKYDDLLHLSNFVIENAPKEQCQLIGKAWELQGKGLEITYKPAEALVAFRNCKEVLPNSPEAIANYYAMMEKLGQHTDSLEELEEELKRFPQHPALLLVLARYQRRLKEYKAGIENLENALSQSSSDHVTRQILYLLGDLLDKIGDYSTAYSTFTAANELVQNKILGQSREHLLYLQSTKQNLAYFKNQASLDWNISPGKERKDPVFLVGFPRTGSTLLEQILYSHRDFVTVEERLILQSVLMELTHEQQATYPASLSTLSGNDLERLRQKYWQTINQYIPEDKRHLRPVDKFPLNSTHYGLLHMLFPNAKVIFTIRHPLDACLSSFMQNFSDDAAMLNFLQMDSTVELFATVIDLWEEYKRLLAMDQMMVKYENLTQDMESTVLELLDFLGCEWDDNIRKFDRVAIERQSVSTASYHQVSEQLTDRSVYRWKNYRAQLEPYIPRLQPYIEKLGYET